MIPESLPGSSPEIFPHLFRDDVFRIETRRLWLRWPTARDADEMVRLAGERAVSEMTTSIPHPLDRGSVDAFLLRARGANCAGTGLTLALAGRAAPARPVGVIEIAPGKDLSKDLGMGAPRLGYWLGREYWGRGLMSEAAGAMVGAYFAWAGGRCLTAEARADNPASHGVLRRAGFAPAGRAVRSVPGRGDREVACFALERAAWLRAEAADAGAEAA